MNTMAFISSFDDLFNVQGSLCWLIIMFNILAIFFLVFCSFYRITKIVRLTGWVWTGFLFCINLGVMIFKPDIYSLLCVLFTVMLMMAIISVVLPIPDGNAPPEQPQEIIPKIRKVGSYVISKMKNNKFCFELYDPRDKCLAKSFHCYTDIDMTKEHIALSRENGEIASLEDRTGHWIKEMKHPKFVLLSKDNKFMFQMRIQDKFVIMESELFDDLDECKSCLNKAMKAVKSKEVYISIDKLLQNKEKYYKNKLFTESTPHTKEQAKINVQKEPKVQKTEQKTEKKFEQIAIDELDVKFATNKKLTLKENYALLSKEQKSFFDELKKVASKKQDIKMYEYKNNINFMFGREKLLTLKIKQGTVVAGFTLTDQNFTDQLNTGEAKLEETPTVIRVKDKSYLKLALETIDLKYKTLVESKNQQKELAEEQKLGQTNEQKIKGDKL